MLWGPKKTPKQACCRRTGKATRKVMQPPRSEGCVGASLKGTLGEGSLQ